MVEYVDVLLSVFGSRTGYSCDKEIEAYDA